LHATLRVGDLHDAVLGGQDLVAFLHLVANVQHSQLAVRLADDRRAPETGYDTERGLCEGGHDVTFLTF
jgi:hypothetical protein